MERFQKRQLHFPEKLIHFVTPAEAEKVIEQSTRCVISGVLDGKEAKEFYDNIVSLPSTSTIPLQNKKPVMKFNEKNVLPNHSKKRTSVQISKQNNLKTNAVFRHAQDGKLKEVQDCISGGCSVNQSDMYGWTPLMCAACEGHYNIVEYLLKIGANLNIKNTEGLTALDIAERKGHLAVAKLLKIGIIKEEESHVLEIEENEKYCNDCKIFYKESTVLHNRCISHLFSIGKRNDSTFYHIPESNKGFQMMLRSGWDMNKGLGVNAEGRKFPIKTVIKDDRSCIGRKKLVPKITHFGPHDKNSVNRHGVQVERKVRERTLKKWQREKLIRKERQREIYFRRQFL